ncbi:MAG: SDR family NAD(P)-dependent oxidoreductase [Parvibaculaceae bacterium]
MAYAPFDLTGKTILVTGGNGGIGFGMAEAMASAGANVVIWGTNEQKNASALDTLKAYGGEMSARRVDVADAALVAEEMSIIVRDMGRIDAVFANAGVGSAPKPFLDQTQDEWNKLFAVNLHGVASTLREGARAMVARAKDGEPGGSLVAVASLAGVDAAPFMEAYGTAKGGVISLMKDLAVELARYGVRSNTIIPGWIATDMTARSQSNPAIADKVIPRVPMRRWGTPEDFGAAAIYLASDGSRFHTGDTMIIDGGYAVY